jgi:transposase-like protein
VKKERRHWSADERIKLLRRHLIEIPISKICEEARLAPSLFHRWQEQLFQDAVLVLEGKRPERNQDQQRSRNWRTRSARISGSTQQPFRAPQVL